MILRMLSIIESWFELILINAVEVTITDSAAQLLEIYLSQEIWRLREIKLIGSDLNGTTIITTARWPQWLK